MRSILLTFSIVLLVTFAVFGQTPAPKPSTTPPDDDVVKISTSLIQIDVSVTDSKGKVITDLKPDEIEIYENGEKQKISHLSFVSSVKEITERPKVLDKDAIIAPPTLLRPEQIRRTIALVVDDLSLSFESAYYTRRALKKFVDEQMQDGDMVAIIRTGAGIGALQQFTADKRILYAAIERVRWNPLGSGGIGVFAPIESAPDESQDPADTTQLTEDSTESSGSGQSLDDFRRTIFATGTLGALRYIVRGMSELPGRKSVIFFSDGFRLIERDSSGFQQTGSVMDFMRQLVDAANRSSVVFYTIDPRGLQYTGLTAADNAGGMNAQQMSDTMSARSQQLSETQDGLRYLAYETGGFAIVNSNDISGGVRRVLDDQSYYLVAYEPDSDTFDPTKRKFNKLEVKVLRRGAKVRYRSGFFNVADRPERLPTQMSPVAQLQNALVSPFAVSGVGLRLNALFGSDEQNSPYVRSLLHINAADFKFTDEPEGVKKAVFDVLAMSFGDNGQPVDMIGKTYTIALKPDAYAKIIREGFVYHFVFPVKMPGAYQYRVAIRDTLSGKVGSASQFIDVPNLKKGRLTVSSLILENLTPGEWEQMSDPNGAKVYTDPMSDTALRLVKLGSILRYGFEVYNAKFVTSKMPELRLKIRVFRESKLVMDGEEKPLVVERRTDPKRIKYTGAISLGAKSLPGDYVLQIVLTDPLAKPKYQRATQFVQFEVVE